jgi:hypothetical protein
LSDNQHKLLNLQRKSFGKVSFVDAAHFVLGAFVGMIWCFARVLVKTPPGRKRDNVRGAIDSDNQEVISILTTENISSLRSTRRG